MVEGELMNRSSGQYGASLHRGLAMGCSAVALACLLAIVDACGTDRLTQSEPGEGVSMYARWTNGPPKGDDYFPVAVWLQDPENASRYRDAGINLYVGLWEGPTQAQLAGLKAAGMQVICDQNQVGLEHLDDPVIAGWMYGDEPDNAQSLPDGSGYGPPIEPRVVVEAYRRMKERDPSRPVLLNLGQGVAWDEYVGRGVRTGHPEDYPEYVQGADIVSFDIYPVASTYAQTSGNLWYVARGVERLRSWARPDQPVWNCIECSRIYSEQNKATPAQVKAEVWMALIHGSTGLIYFVHEWYPRFNEHALLDDPEMLGAVTAINQQIHELAPVLNRPTVAAGVQVSTSSPEVPVAAMVKHCQGKIWVFAVGMRPGEATASFSLGGIPARATAEVIGEDRRIEVNGGQFTDHFAPYQVHLYCVR